MAATMTWFLGSGTVLAEDHLVIKEEIGHGQGGVVYSGILSSRLYALRPVAIKQLKSGAFCRILMWGKK